VFFDAQRGRELNANYSFRGAAAELARTLPLAPDETVTTEGALRTYDGPFSQRMTYLRLTRDRLCLLRHHLAGPDKISEIPRIAMRSVEVEGRLIYLSWTQTDGQLGSTHLSAWTGRSPVRKPYRTLDTLTAQLTLWAGH
jgi:hypothetical protein